MTRHIKVVDGRLVFVHDDGLHAALGRLGAVSIERASHVEPNGTQGLQWTADLRPCGGPVLGPSATRGEALDREREWLEDGGMTRYAQGR